MEESHLYLKLFKFLLPFYIKSLQPQLTLLCLGVPLRESHFDEFVECYMDGDLKKRTPTYSEENPNGRWRKFTIEEIKARDKTSLDITWMRNATTGDDCTLAELLEQIKEKSMNIANAVAALKELIGEVDE